MNPSIRIAHLSDLHASASEDFDQHRIVRAACADLARLHEQSPIHLAVFSGDLAFRGVADEFALARQLLIEPVASTLGLSMTNIVVVPGNHDVDRTQVVDFVEAGLKASLVSRETVNELLGSSERLALAAERLKSWDEFHADLYAGVDVERPSPLGLVHRIEVDGSVVGVAALNSAWRAFGGDADRRELLVGDRQLEPALDAIADADFQVAVVHHPLDWLKSFDGDRVRQFFQTRRLVVLSGHEHTPDPQAVVGQGGHAVYSRAGCLYESHQYPNSYSIIELARDGSEVIVHVREWYPERDTGIFAEAGGMSRGTRTLPWGKSEMTLAARLPFSVVTGALADVAQETSLVRDVFPGNADVGVDDLLVPPRFLKVPYQEAVAASAIGEGIDPELLAEAPEVRPGDVVIICAEPDIGVTSAILWLLARQYAASGHELPIYLSSDVRVGTQRTERALVEAAARAGYSRAMGDLPPLIIGIDDVSARKPNRLSRLAGYIASHQKYGYILGCHGTEHALIAEALRSAAIDAERVFLAPFGRSQLRQFLRKVVGRGDNEMIERIFRLIRSQGLPRSPLVMAALIVVLRDEENPREINESSLLQAYINFMLGGSELSDAEGFGMNFRIRQHLLAAFAHELQATPERGVARLDAENFFGAYFRERGLLLSPGLVMQSLIDRRVLIEDDGQVAFRHPAFLALFTAQWMLEDAQFAEELTADTLRHAEVIKHLAGLRRSDRALLERVGQQVLDATAEVRRVLDVGAFDQSLTRDASDPKELDEIRQQLLSVPEPPDETALDKSLDRLEDALDHEDEPDLPRRPIDEFVGALQLLSDVLRNSELVDDVELKVSLLKEAVRAWSLLAVALPLEVDDEDGLLERLREAVGQSWDEEDFQRRLRRLVRLLTLVFVGILVSSSLGTVHLGTAIDSALNDEEVMVSPTRGWVLTLLCCQLELPGWASQLIRLHGRYPSHVFLREVIEDFALHRYRTTANQAEATALEPFLADVFAAKTRGGRDRVASRATERSQILEDLRSGRMRYLKVGHEPSLLDEALPGDGNRR